MPAMNPEVETIFKHYPDAARDRLLFLRELIFAVAAQTEGVGELEETLKWGQVSYLTPQTKSGTTIRIDAIRARRGQVGIYVNCQTTLVETYRKLYGDTLTFEHNRCIKLDGNADIPVEAVKHCIQLALTYHLDKKRKS